MKKCGKCKQEKSKEAFSIRKAAKDGLQSRCKQCVKEYDKERHSKRENKDRKNQTTRERRKRYKAWIQAYKKRHGCLNCAENEPVCLDFHHKDDDKEETIANTTSSWSLKRIKEEIKKRVVLCSNCHRKVHAGLIELD